MLELSTILQALDQKLKKELRWQGFKGTVKSFPLLENVTMAPCSPTWALLEAMCITIAGDEFDACPDR